MKYHSVSIAIASLVVLTSALAQDDRVPTSGATPKDLTNAYDIYKKRLTEGGNPVLKFNSGGATIEEGDTFKIRKLRIPDDNQIPAGPKLPSGTFPRRPGDTWVPAGPTGTDPSKAVIAALEARIAAQEKLIRALETKLAECESKHSIIQPKP